MKFDSGSGELWLINNSITYPAPMKYSLDVTQAVQPVCVMHTNWFDAAPAIGAGEPYLAKQPGHLDREAGRYALSADSANIDAAGFVTRTNSAGQGDTIDMEDTGSFNNGWGWLGGDLIRIRDE